MEPQLQPSALSLESKSCYLRVSTPQRQRLAPLGLHPSSSNIQRWLWSTLYRHPHLPHPPHPRPHPPPGLWRTQVLRLLHPHKDGRLQAAINTACLWTLKWTTLMVKPPYTVLSYLKTPLCIMFSVKYTLNVH